MTIHHRDIAAKESEGVAGGAVVLLLCLCLTPSTRWGKNNCNGRCTMRQFRVATGNLQLATGNGQLATCKRSRP